MSNNKKFKEETVCMIDTMIENADKGPSGFWVEDHEGCGNPRIFPEFEEGLKNGRLVQKQHYLCPWNTAVLFGKTRGNVHTGCYYSCSIQEAEFLPSKKIKIILKRFKQKLVSGEYDNLDDLNPLLTKEEILFIEQRKNAHRDEQEQKRQKEAQKKLDLAENLIKRLKDTPEAHKIIAAHYGDNISTMTYEFGYVHFSPDSMKNIVGGDKLTYDDYLELQIRSHGKTKTSFEQCFFEYGLEYRGQIEKKTKNKICFKRIYIIGMYSDGVMFEGKEDHVWMDIQGFEKFEIDDCVKFSAEVYRYIKTSNGKILDYALRTPSGITKIDNYSLPTDEDLLAQELALIQCETCYMNKHCNKTICILSTAKKQNKKEN